MKELIPDKKRILNFSEKYVESVKSNAKKAFGQACKKDERLPSKYKEYVCNPNNVNVAFRPLYGRAIDISLSSVHADYSFSYKDSYYQTTGFKGDIKFDGYGDGHLSNVETTGEMRSYTAQSSGSTSFYSTAFQKCEMGLGVKSALKNINNYVDVTNSSLSNLPRGLHELASERITYDTINSYMSINSLPDHVYEKMKNDAIRGMTNNPINFKMKLTNYYIDELYITYLPYSYELDVWVDYEGETYSLKNLSDWKQINSQGPLSDHYKKYITCQTRTRCNFNLTTKSKIKPLYILSAVLTFLSTALIILMFVFASDMKHEAFLHMYLWGSIPLALVGVAVSVVSICILCKRRTLYIPDEVYSSQREISDLQTDMNKIADRQKKRIVKAARLWLCTVLIITAGITFGTSKIWSDTYNEYFWYTPEIIRTYQGEESGAYYMLEITDCDKNGKFEAIDLTVYNDKIAKALYEGQITSKNGNKLKATLTLKKKIIDPQSGGSFRESCSLTFTDDFCQIEGWIYPYTGGMRSDNAFFANSLEAHELEKTYLYYKSGTASILEITSCNSDGCFGGTYLEISNEGFCKKSISGEILALTSANDAYLNILSSTDINKSKDISFDTTTPIYVTNNFGKLTFNNKEFKVENNSFKTVSSAEELKNLSGSVAVLTADIDFKGEELYPLTYSGSIIGNGHAIKNYKLKVNYYSYSDNYVGLFKMIDKNSFVFDLKIENVTTEYYDKEDVKAGSLAVLCYGSLFEISATGQINIPNGSEVGGIVGYYSGKAYYNVTSSVELVGKSSNKLFGKEK